MLKALLNFLTGNGSAAKSAETGNGKTGSQASGGSLHDLEGFVSYVVCALVDNPGDVSIRRDGRGVLDPDQLQERGYR